MNHVGNFDSGPRERDCCCILFIFIVSWILDGINKNLDTKYRSYNLVSLADFSSS